MKKLKNMSMIGFVLSAIGTAVGLGNIWGFPTKMIEYGGPAFLIPYIIAVVILGLPILILEINLGAYWRKTPITIFQKYIGKKGKFFGWFQTLTQLLIGTYYITLIAWLIISIFSSFEFNANWSFSEKILNNNQSNVSAINGFGDLGDINFKVLGSAIAMFVLVWFIIYFGINKGIEKTNMIIMPLLFIMIIGFVIYTCQLDGANTGLNIMFKPDFEKIMNYKAWSAAFSQAFFSLSLVLATIIVYSSRSPVKGDRTNQALIVMSGDTLIALLSCVIIGATIGYSETKNLIEISDVEEEIKIIDIYNNQEIHGPSLIFEIFPKTFHSINESNFLSWERFGSVLAILFYTSLLFAAISSLIGLLEPTAAGLIENYNVKRWVGATFGVLIQFIFGFIYFFQFGHLTILKITDGIFITNLILISAIGELSILLYRYRNIQGIMAWNNNHSFLKLKKWYYYLLIAGLIILVGIFILGIYGNSIKPDDFKNFSNFQWILTIANFFIPFFGLILILGFTGKKSTNSL